MAVGAWSGDSRYSLRFEMWVVDQDVATNSSRVGWAIYVEKNYSGGGISSGSGYTRTVSFSGDWSGTLDWSAPYNFSAYSSLYIGGAVVTVTHDADGTKSLSVGTNGIDSATLGAAYAGQVFVLPPIARATLPSFSSGSVDAGSPVTINLPRASSNFTHDVTYSFGSASGTIATGAGTSTSWTPPLSLLSEIPNAASGTALITVVTKNGATVIGTKSASLTVAAGSAIVPDFTAVTHAENVAAIASAVGAYVQGKSKLDLAITGAAGIYGSTIPVGGYRIEVAGQTILAATGTTAEIAATGALTITATITDSRGRTRTRTASIAVLAYAPPAITAFQIRRALIGGTLDDDGTYLRVDLTAAVQSLVNGSQKNALQYRISTKVRSTPTWTAGSWETPGGISFASFDVDVSVPTSQSRDVRIEVRDALGTIATVQGVLATSAVQVDLPDAYDAIAVGQRYDAGVGGSIQAVGRIFSRVDKMVIDADDVASDTAKGIVELATSAETATGTDTGRAVTPAGLLGRTATDARIGLVELATNAEALTGTDTSRAMTAANVKHVLDNRPLPHRMASGRASVGTGGLAITFPSGRFSVAPILLLTARTPSLVVVPYLVDSSLNASGFTVYVYTIGGAAVSGYIEWTAIQMTSGSAAG